MPDQVGRRPSNPAFLAIVGVVWIACGIVAATRLTASWKIIVAIVFLGIGGLFLRGAVVARSRDHR